MKKNPSLLHLTVLIFLLPATNLFPQDYTEACNWALGRTDLRVDDVSYNLDCSGLIYAIYHKSGYYMQPELWNYQGSGVQRLYSWSMDKGQILAEPPQAGDLIFWDNSYDKNGNGLWDDDLTHVGMVIKIDQDGLVHFIHNHYRLGPVEAVMDPAAPDDPERNSAMRARGQGSSQGWSAGHLFRCYGRVTEE